ncbi:hypothetical protein RRG08_038352 [Elysia crispata]|uniref:Neurotransmitter-gated ion-channel ligand-binding domain-containing protein n=1 Tax=Elysia crispata TaxID=231223 RepID=A0AAE0YQF6_9GAST|nr:hypothetical protein RRG08_038352 [Elysia crispata]
MFHNGSVIWEPAFTATFGCEVHIPKYPLDESACKIVVGPWANYNSSIVMELHTPHMHLEETVSNGQFEVHLGDAYKRVFPYEQWFFEQVVFTLKLIRKPAHAFISLLLPLFVFSLTTRTPSSLAYCSLCLSSHLPPAHHHPQLIAPSVCLLTHHPHTIIPSLLLPLFVFSLTTRTPSSPAYSSLCLSSHLPPTHHHPQLTPPSVCLLTHHPHIIIPSLLLPLLLLPLFVFSLTTLTPSSLAYCSLCLSSHSPPAHHHPQLIPPSVCLLTHHPHTIIPSLLLPLFVFSLTTHTPSSPAYCSLCLSSHSPPAHHHPQLIAPSVCLLTHHPHTIIPSLLLPLFVFSLTTRTPSSLAYCSLCLSSHSPPTHHHPQLTAPSVCLLTHHPHTIIPSLLLPLFVFSLTTRTPSSPAYCSLCLSSHLPPLHHHLQLTAHSFDFSLTTLTPSFLVYSSLCLSSHSPPSHHHPQLIAPSVCLLTHQPHTIIPSLFLPLFVFSLTTRTPSSPASCSLCLSSHLSPAHHHPQLPALSVCLLTYHRHTIIPSFLLSLSVFSLTTRTPSSPASCSLCLSSHLPPAHHHPQLIPLSVCLLTYHQHTIIPSFLLSLSVFSLTTRTPSSSASCSLCLSSHLPPAHHHPQLPALSVCLLTYHQHTIIPSFLLSLSVFSLTTSTPSSPASCSLCLSSHLPPAHHHPQLPALSVCLLTYHQHTIIPSFLLSLSVFSLTTSTPSSPASCSLCLSSHLPPAHHHPQLPALSVCLLTYHQHTIIPSFLLSLFLLSLSVFSLTTRTPSSPASCSLCLSSHLPPAHHHPQLPAPSVCLLTHHPHTIIPSLFLLLFVFSLTTRTPSSPAYSSLCLSSHSPPAHHHPQLPAPSVCLLTYHPHTIIPSFLLSLSVFSLTTRTPSSPAYSSLYLSSHSPPAHHHPQLPALSVCLLNYHQHTILPSFLLSLSVFSLTTRTPSSPASCSLCLSSHLPPAHHHPQLPALSVCLLTYHRHTIISSFLLSVCVFSLTTDTPSSPASCSLCVSSHSPPTHHHLQLPALCVCLLTHHRHTIIQSFLLSLCVFSLTTDTPSSPGSCSLCLSSHSPPAHHHPQLPALSVCLLTHHPHTIIVSLFLPLFVFSLTTLTPSSLAYSSLYLSSHSPPAHHHPQLTASSVCLLTHHPHTIIPSLFLPLFVLSLLGPVAFLIPPVDAEKVNMSVTVLLAIVVFTGLVHGNLPNRSDQTSMLVIYVSSLLVLAFFGVLGNTIVLAVHRKQNEQVQASTCSLPEGVSRDLCSSLKACHASIKQSDSGHSEKCSEAGSEKTCVLPAKLPPEPKLRAERLNMIFFVSNTATVMFITIAVIVFIFS